MKIKIKSLIPFCFFLCACGPAGLKDLKQDALAVEVKDTAIAFIDYCTEEDELATDVKTIVMLDRSASNCDERGNCASGVNGTDPDRIFRTEGLIEYLSGNFSDNEYFALMNFYCPIDDNGCQASAGSNNEGVIPDKTKGVGSNLTPSNDYSPFMKNKASDNSSSRPFKNIVENFRDTPDESNRGTNYGKALKSIRDLIVEDVRIQITRHNNSVIETGNEELEIKPAIYKIVFTSDGQPTDTSPDMYQTELIDYITNQIKSLEQDVEYGPFIRKIYFSTAFYHFREISDAENLLRDMAEAGGGKYISFFNQSIDFEKLLNVPIVKVRTTEEYFIVNNVNTVWNRITSSLEADTDGDGIPDSREIPGCEDKVDCDFNGLSDHVEEYVFGTPCTVDVDFYGKPYCDLEYKKDICDTEDTSSNPSIDNDNDGLNQCEENLLGTSDKKYDSNDDGIMDGLAFRFGLDLVKAISGTSRPQSEVDSDNDKVSNFDEVKFNTPVDFENDSIKGLKPYIYTKFLKPPTSDNPYKRCYHLEVDDISVVSPNDELEIHFVQKEANGAGRLFYKRVRKKATDKKFIFQPEDI
jgi:hypothetical protein